MKKFYCLFLSALALGFSENLSAYEVTIEWDNPGSILLATGSASNPEMLTLSSEQTQYVYQSDDYTELSIFPADGYALTRVSRSDDPEGNNSITRNAVYRQQSYYGVGDSWNGRVISVETDRISYDGELSIKVVNGADCLDAYLDMTRTEGSGLMQYTYGYQETLSLTDSDNKIPFASEYMKNLTISLKRNALAKSVYKLTRNGEEQTPVGNDYYMADISAADVIEVQVYEGEVPVREDVTLTLDYPEAIEGCIKNLFDRTNSEFLGLDADYNFVMPADRSFTVLKGSEIQVNFNDGYTLTKFMLGSEDVTDAYSEAYDRIRVTVDENVTLTISGEMTQYEDVEFTAYVLNADGVRLGLEKYTSIHNPIKDVTGEEGEPVSNNILIPSFTVGDKNSDSGIKTIPSVVMNSDNTLKFTVKVSERSPMIYISPVVGYYIQSVWDSTMEAPISYVDGNEENQRTFYIVAQPLERDKQFIVDMPGSEEVNFRPFEFFTRNWDNPSISFSIGTGERTYDYNATYENPFTLYPTSQYPGFSLTLNGSQTGITETEYGTYLIDFTQVYSTADYPIPTLKITSAMSGVEEIEANNAAEVDTTVYNLQGVRLNTEWESLPSGIYIRAGKKVVKQ